MTRATALQIYRNLPKKDCSRCGEKTCMAYAMKLYKRIKKHRLPLLTKKQMRTIERLTAPAVQEVLIGPGKGIKTGGEEVLYRHEYRYVNPAAIFIEVSDNMDAAEIEGRIKTCDVL